MVVNSMGAREHQVAARWSDIQVLRYNTGSAIRAFFSSLSKKVDSSNSQCSQLGAIAPSWEHFGLEESTFSSIECKQLNLKSQVFEATLFARGCSDTVCGRSDTVCGFKLIVAGYNFFG